MIPTQITLNPINHAYHCDVSADVAQRRRRVQALLQERHIGALLLEKGVDGNYLWLNDVTPMAAPMPGLALIPAQGEPMILEGYGVLESGRAQRPADSWMPCPGGVRVIDGLSALDLKDMLGDTKRLGVVYPDQLRCAVMDFLRQRLPEVELVDLTEAYNLLKAEKSDVEIGLAEYTAGKHDQLFQSLPAMLNPGRYERDLVQEIRHSVYRNGGGGFGVFYSAMIDLISFQPGEAADAPAPRYPGRALRNGDAVWAKVQAAYLNGCYGMLGRCFTLGEPDARVQEQWNAAVYAAQYAAGLTVPGACLKEIAQRTRAEVERLGYELAEPLFAHSVGCSYVESPMPGDPTESAPLRENMTLAIGPAVRRPGEHALACWDVYLVGADGARRLSLLAQDLLRA